MTSKNKTKSFMKNRGMAKIQVMIKKDRSAGIPNRKQMMEAIDKLRYPHKIKKVEE
jgi:hypothetical protein